MPDINAEVCQALGIEPIGTRAETCWQCGGTGRRERHGRSSTAISFETCCCDSGQIPVPEYPDISHDPAAALMAIERMQGIVLWPVVASCGLDPTVRTPVGWAWQFKGAAEIYAAATINQVAIDAAKEWKERHEH